MKIVYLVGGFPKLSETFILNQITGLIDRGHEIEIVAYQNPREEKVHEDVLKYGLLEKTHYIQYKDDQSLLNTSNVRQLVSCLDADIIHVHFAARPADVALDILRKIGIPYIITAHAYDIFISPDVEGLRAKFRAAEKVITVSQFNRKYLLDLLGQEFAEKIEVQYLGIDLNKFKFVERGPGEKVAILFIGRLIEKKGVLDAIEAFRYVVEKHSAVELRIIGEGPQKEEALRKVEEFKITDNVKLLGSLTQEDVTEEMKMADIFFLPSVTALDGDREGLPVVVLEAEAVGLPVVSTRHTGIPEAVIDKESGYLLEEHDTRGMAARICELIGNPDLRARMGIAGRQVVETRHDLGREIDRLEKLIVDTVQINEQQIEVQDRCMVEYEKRVSRYYAEVMEHLEQKLKEQETGFAQKLKEQETGFAQKLKQQETGFAQKLKQQEHGFGQKINQQEQQIRQQEALLRDLEGFIRRIQRTIFYRIYRRILDLSRKKEEIDIVFSPEWTQHNPYQKLLYKHISDMGFKTSSLPAKNFKLLWLFLNRNKVRFIHLHWLSGIYDPRNQGITYKKAIFFYIRLVIAKALGYRIWWTVHNLNSHESSHKRLEMWTRRKVAKLADKVMVHCNYAKEVIQKHWNVEKNKIKVIPHGSYVDYYPNCVSREEARKILGIKDEYFTFLFFGMIRNYKGLKPLIRSFKEVRFAYPDTRLIIAGRPFNETIKKETEMLCDDNNISLFLNYIPDEEIQNFFNASDIVILPYQNVLTSGAAVLAISFGKGVIAPRKGCMPELITDEIGFLYDEENHLTDAMSRAIKYADIKNIEKATLKIAKETRWERMAREYYSPMLIK